MKLRSTLCAVAAAMTVGVMGCGEQPRYYRVSVDRAPLGSMPSSCYSSGSAPTPNDRTTNTVDVEQWVLWDGVEGGKYLEVSDINYPLGDVRVDIEVGGAIVSTEADKPTFTTERVQTGPNRSSRATYTLDKAGETLEGTIALSYECTGTTGCPVANCSASLPFVGRRLTAEPMVVVNNGAN